MMDSGRKVRGAARRALSLGATAVSALVLVASCGGTEQRKGPAAAAPPQAERTKAAAARSADPQVRAQLAWCRYLEALYLRAEDGASSWPRFAECVSVRTVAAPELLVSAAECSTRELQTFAGSPFSPEYALAVGRCGRDAFDASARNVKPADIEQVVAAACDRAATCEALDGVACRAAVHEALGSRLERTVGALNETGRERLRACLRVSRCGDLGGQITGCVEPLLDELLWLPG